MSSQTQSIDELIENFEYLGDWEQRFTYLIDLGKKLPDMPAEEMIEAHRVHGCQATVYMAEHMTDGESDGEQRMTLHATADAHIVRGLIAILLMLYDGKTPAEILAVKPEPIFRKMDLVEHLSPTRRNGLHSMISRIRLLAQSHLN